jgi:putative spermidine/putrescine transport system permease protein
VTATDGRSSGAALGGAAADPGGPRRGAGALLLGPIAAWMAAAFALPLAIVVLLSLQPASDDVFAPLTFVPSADQYAAVLLDAYTLKVLLDTVLLGVAVTAASVVLAYPIALWLVRLPPRWRAFGVALVLVPLLTNVVVRSLGIILILSPGGVVAGLFGLLGLPAPRMLFTWFAVGLALVQVFMPYMVMALYDALQGTDERAEAAAAGLGAGPVRRFFEVVLPLSLNGLRGGLVLVFLMSSTAYVSATLLGGKQVWVGGMLVFEEAMQLLDYPKAAAVALAMLAISVAATVAINRGVSALMPWRGGSSASAPARRWPEPPPALSRAAWAATEAVGPWASRALLLLGLAVLLFPMVLVVVSSVNDSPQATVAEFLGFTWRWYALVFDNPRYVDAFFVSLRLALAAVAVSLAISLPAAFALERARVPARETVAAMLMLPLALPGIAIALGMLRLLQWFVQIDPFLGLLAVHVVLIAPFTLAMLRATVAQLDRSLEEAASGLGAGPSARLRHVVMPQLAPGIMAAGIIGFLISFGEVTVTAFLTSPRMQTLPVRIYAEATFSLENTVNAISTLIILATVALLVLVNRFVRLDRVWHR